MKRFREGLSVANNEFKLQFDKYGDFLGVDFDSFTNFLETMYGITDLDDIEYCFNIVNKKFETLGRTNFGLDLALKDFEF